METKLISINEVCLHHKVEIQFIQSLEEIGLIHTQTVKRSTFIDLDELDKLERYLRLAQDLEINLEGLHAISILLAQIEKMQNELLTLKNELIYYKKIN
jgi:hypothetical protein